MRKKRYGESVFREKVPVIEFSQVQEEETAKSHKSVAETMRKKGYYQNLEALNVKKI